MKKLVIAAFLATLPAPAYADAAAAEACAAKLEGDQRIIFDATKPLVQPGTDLKAVITEATTNLVMGGNVARDTAEASAKKAGPCLQKLL